MRILFRPSNTHGQWQDATVQEESATTFAIVGITAGDTYDFCLLYTHSTYMSSPATIVNSYYVVGRTAAPAALSNLSLAVVGGQALLRWDLPADLDVQIGGWIVFRHSPLMSGATWPDSTSLARAVNGDQTHCYMPLKPGTYLARVYDSGARASAGVASVSTSQASALAFTPVDDLIEDPTFAGVKDDCEVVSSALQLIGGDFDTVTDTDALADWDQGGIGIVSTGTYHFDAGMDFGSVRPIRLTSHITIQAINPYDTIDERANNVDDWADIDGTAGAVVDASVWGQFTNDNPAATPTWGPWVRIDANEITARAVGNVECRMSSEDVTFNLAISELRLNAEQVS